MMQPIDPTSPRLVHARSLLPGRDVRFETDAAQPHEGFAIDSIGPAIRVRASTPNGFLYGCLDASERLARSQPVDRVDAPQFRLRGPCIGIQKTFLLPGRNVYEYPYTNELFPFFYDRAMWIDYLDRLLRWRFNALTLWNGHPFASFVRVPGFEYAVEVSTDQFDRNVDTLNWLTAECDRRGIWLIQSFYSLLVPKPFADHHGCDTQLSAPTPAATDYTRQAIAQFVATFPSVGLMPCLGEALSGIDNQIFWCNEVILAGVKDGLKFSGRTDQPPIVIRTHATDARKVIPGALQHYQHLYTEQKYNGESLTTSEPRGVRQALHLEMSRLGSTHVANVHILANLEPFRYAAQRFIRECMVAARDRLGAHGLHLYPLAFWNWPFTPDGDGTTLLQWDRDWMWFEAWARFAWNPDRHQADDRRFWIDTLAGRFGNRAERVLDALNDIGECAPRLLRRFGITEGNRQTMSLGMTLDQLVNPERYRPFSELWESQAPPGERLQEFVAKELAGEPHAGETPTSIIDEACDFAGRALNAIDAAAPITGTHAAELESIRNDVRCIHAMTHSYAAKVRAAICVLTHRSTRDLALLEQAAAHLKTSLDDFRRLEHLTRSTYAFANSMQTSQRRIPVPGGADGKAAHFHWSQLLPIYEAEYQAFVDALARARTGASDFRDESSIASLPKVKLKVVSGNAQTFDVMGGSRAFADEPTELESIAPELTGLQGIRVNRALATGHRLGPIEIEVGEPIKLLVGYFQSTEATYLKMPDLELDAAAVDVVDDAPALQNVVTIRGLPPVNVHAWRFDAGRHVLDLRGTGLHIILGAVPLDTPIEPRDCGRQ
jgi:hypothetical protein